MLYHSIFECPNGVGEGDFVADGVEWVGFWDDSWKVGWGWLGKK